MEKIFKYLHSPTLRNSSTLIISTILSSVTGLLITLLLAKKLSVSDFGLFLSGLNLALIIIHFSDFGLSTSLPHFISHGKFEKKTDLIKTLFLSRLFTAIIIGIATYLLALPIARYLLRDKSMLPIIQYSAIGIPFYILITWEQSFLQAKKIFLKASLMMNSINLARFLTLIVIAIIGFFSLYKGYLLSQLILIPLAIYGMKLLEVNPLKGKLTFKNFKKVWIFSSPLAISVALGALYTRLDQLFVLSIAGSTQAGIYGLASRISGLLFYFSFAIGGATSPRFASIPKEKFKIYFNQVILAALGLSLLILIGIYIAPFFLILIFGNQFKDSILPFEILSIGYIFYIFTTLFSNAITFHFKQTKLLIWISLLSTFLIWILLSELIPKYKSTGAAIAVSSVYLIQLIIFVLYYLWISKKKSTNDN